MKEAKLVLHHDDPPCYKRLNKRGSCDHCGVHPDMQSTRFHSYCPTCEIELKKMKCPSCSEEFRLPD